MTDETMKDDQQRLLRWSTDNYDNDDDNDQQTIKKWLLRQQHW